MRPRHARRSLLILSVLALVATLVVDAGSVWARAGSGGSRGSRSYSSPRRVAPLTPSTPTSPTRPAPAPTAPGPIPPSQPSLFGGLMRGLAGFALGGLLGHLLFGGMGGGFGVGFLDLVLVGVAVFLLVSVLRRRRAAEPEPAYAGGPALGGMPDVGASGAAEPLAEADAGAADLERGIGHIRQMDPGFDPEALVEQARATFLDVQRALGKHDLAPVRDLLTADMYAPLQAQCDQLRAAGRTNIVDHIVVHRAEVTEAWQEAGRDYVTVALQAAMLDYVVDDRTGAVVEGSRTAAQEAEEYWTFTRPVGDNPWQLSAIQTP